MMKMKHVKLLGLTLAQAALIAGLSQTAALAETTLRFAHVLRDGDPAHLGGEVFKEEVEKNSNGRITVKMFPAAQLGNNRKLLTQLKSGAIDMSFTPYPMLADVVPEFNIVTSGYMFDSWKQLSAVLGKAEFGQAWNDSLVKESGLRILGSFYYGARNLTTTKTEVRSPEDLEGLKVRATTNPMSIAVVRGLGGKPTPVAWPEVFQGLRQGMVDGQENPIPVLHAAKLYEVQGYLIKTEHQRTALPFVMRDSALGKLSAADQDILRKAAVAGAEAATEAMIKLTVDLEDDLTKKGMTVIDLTDAQRGAFKERVQASVKKDFDGKVLPAGLLASISDYVKTIE